jgi:hypothetical protein
VYGDIKNRKRIAELEEALEKAKAEGGVLAEVTIPLIENELEWELDYDIENEIENIRSENDDAALNEFCEWKYHEDDMKEISLKHPNVLFELRGYGDSPWDVWVKYFCDGMMQVAKVTITAESVDKSKFV